jgi:hypothetical protein
VVPLGDIRLIGLLLGFASITYLMCDFIQQHTQTYAFRFLHRIHRARLHEAAALCCPHRAVLLFYQTAGSATVLSTACGVVLLLTTVITLFCQHLAELLCCQRPAVLLFYRQKAAIQCCQQHALLIVINNRQCSCISILRTYIF